MGDIADMIAALVALEDGLTDWEVEFVESVSHRDPERLSDKQRDIIIRLYEEHC